MDAPDCIITALQEGTESREKLESWNTEFEDLTKTPPEADNKPSAGLKSEVSKAANLLHKSLLHVILHLDDYDLDRWEDMSQRALNRWKEFSPERKEEATKSLGPLLRACKNLFRWFLQMYSPTLAPNDPEADAMYKFKAHPMLEFYTNLLEDLSLSNPNLSRHVGLLLFYSTFNPSPAANEKAQISYAFLVNECGFFTKMIGALLVTDHIPLCVALARNIHNIVSSYPPAGSSLKQFSITVTDVERRASWISDSINHVPYSVLYRCLLNFCVSQDPPFPGDEEDLRAELVQEILHTFYAMRAGQNIREDTDLFESILNVIKLESETKRCIDCKLGAVSVLTDSGDEVALALSQSHGSIDALLNLLNVEVSEMLAQTRVDDAGAAGLIPILMVLYKFCKANKTFVEATKAVVFPSDKEPNFWALVAAEKERSPKAKNMSPLDAPVGSLRYQMIKLLTWPQSHVKRFAGELLWILCSNDPQEFVYRVGMGNALPLLSFKRFAQMPANAYS